MATNIEVLSAGAVKPGLTKVIEAFQYERRGRVIVEFATAPVIAKRISNNEPFNIVIAPPEILDDLTKSGQTQGARVTVGRIGVGVMVRSGVALPKIATVEQFKQTLLDSESIVFNQASTGLYIDNLFKQLGIAAQAEAKISRCADFAAVHEQIGNSRGNAIGFGATTVIVESTDKGVTFAGPLPAEIQNYTTYAAALTANADNGAAVFMDYLASSAAKSILKSAGID